MKIIEYSGKVYKILSLTQCCDTPSCIADFLYNGKWYEVKNYEIRAELRKIYDNLTA